MSLGELLAGLAETTEDDRFRLRPTLPQAPLQRPEIRGLEEHKQRRSGTVGESGGLL